MADPGIAPSAAAPPATPRLLDHVVGLIVGHLAGPRRSAWRFGPLAIVSADGAIAATAVRAACEARRVPIVAEDVAIRFGPEFDREIAEAIDDDRLDRLTSRLAGHRLVIVDRIDRIATMERQRSLGHILDRTLEAGVVWVVSTAVHPLDAFGPHVGSRLCGGLVVPLPMDATRRGEVGGPPPSSGRIIRAAARLHDVTAADVIGPSRSRTVAAARCLAMYLCRHLTGRSYHAIGMAFGRRDHTTAMHGVRVCTARIGRDPAFAADVASLAAELDGTGPTAVDPTAACRPGVGSAALARAIGGRRRGRRRMA